MTPDNTTITLESDTTGKIMTFRDKAGNGVMFLKESDDVWAGMLEWYEEWFVPHQKCILCGDIHPESEIEYVPVENDKDEPYCKKCEQLEEELVSVEACDIESGQWVILYGEEKKQVETVDIVSAVHFSVEIRFFHDDRLFKFGEGDYLTVIRK